MPYGSKKFGVQNTLNTSLWTLFLDLRLDLHLKIDSKNWGRYLFSIKTDNICCESGVMLVSLHLIVSWTRTLIQHCKLVIGLYSKQASKLNDCIV